jgi:predicted HAD superfamily phosphohydrolase YqeG
MKQATFVIRAEKPASWERLADAIDNEHLTMSEALWIAHSIITTCVAALDQDLRHIAAKGIITALEKELDRELGLQ